MSNSASRKTTFHQSVYTRRLRLALIPAGVVALLLLASGCGFLGLNQPSACLPANWSVIGMGTEHSPSQWQCQGTTIIAHSSTGDSILASTNVYTDVTLSATVTASDREASLAIRLQDANNGYIVIFEPDDISFNGGQGGIWLSKRIQGVAQDIGSYHGANFPSVRQSVQLSVSALGSSIVVRLNGQSVLQATDQTFTSGRIGLRIYGDATIPCNATFANVVWTP